MTRKLEPITAQFGLSRCARNELFCLIKKGEKKRKRNERRADESGRPRVSTEAKTYFRLLGHEAAKIAGR